MTYLTATALLDLHEPVKSVFEDALRKLYTADVSLETFNSQYLQKHAQDPKAVVAAVRALRVLKAPAEEVDEVVFSLLGGDSVELGVKVRRIPHLFYPVREGKLTVFGRCVGRHRGSGFPAQSQIASGGRVPGKVR